MALIHEQAYGHVPVPSRSLAGPEVRSSEHSARLALTPRGRARSAPWGVEGSIQQRILQQSGIEGRIVLENALPRLTRLHEIREQAIGESGWLK